MGTLRGPVFVRVADYVRANRDRIHERMTFGQVAAEVSRELQVTCTAANARTVLKSVGIFPKGHEAAAKAALTRRTNGGSAREKLDRLAGLYDQLEARVRQLEAAAAAQPRLFA